MKTWKLIVALALIAVFPLAAQAGRAAHFKGWYEILSESGKEQPAPSAKSYFLLDNDTLGVIWERYADGPLPADLEQYRHEQTILAGFTNRSLLFLGLERGALIGNEYLALEGGKGESLELRRRPSGQFDMVATEKGRSIRYLLDVPRESPDSD